MIEDSAQAAELVSRYGKTKKVRYLVNSVLDFREVATTINLMVGRLDDPTEVELIQRNVEFSSIPLPNTLSKFIACFGLPSALLGEARVTTSLRLDFKKFPAPEVKSAFNLDRHQAVIAHPISSLFDLNLAMHDFDTRLAQLVTSSSRLDLKRSVRMRMSPLQNGEGGQLALIIPNVTSEGFDSLKRGSD
jgi:hypothetical protein